MVVLSVVLALAGCSNPEKTGRYLIDAPESQANVPNRLGRVEIRDVSLPRYASSQEITYQTDDGALRSTPDNIWADDPVRGVTLFLAREITSQSGAQAIAEPWPFPDRPDRRVEIRIERMLAQANGQFALSGTYYIYSGDSRNGGGIVRRFDLTEPVLAAGPAEIAAAQSRALQRLAGQIAVVG